MIAFFRSIIAFIIMLVVSAKEGSVVVDPVWVVKGSRSELPCESVPKFPNDQRMLVLWYLSSVTKPIYSYDARGKDFSSGVRWFDEKIVGNRAYFHTDTNPPMLVFKTTLSSDEGTYICRVDYRMSPPTKATINLTVVVPPGKPIIIWNGRGVVGTVGPIKQNERVDLTCRSNGGRPPPTITWTNGATNLPLLKLHNKEDPITGTFVVDATVSVSGKRQLHGSPLTCHVQTQTDIHILNSPSLHPKTVSVSLNITLPPVEVQIIGSTSIVATSGTEITLYCRSFGSHPPADITWWKGSESLQNFSHQTTEDRGNITKSRLTMRVGMDDDNATLTCQANNPAIPDQILMDTTNLVVYYSPVVSLSLGRALDPSNIEEGDDVYFECSITSNPQHHRIHWFHNGMELSENRSAGVMMSTHNLVLPGLHRTHSGSYRCAAANLQGNATSNQVDLIVRHAPVCANPEIERSQGAVRGTTTTVRCEVNAEPSNDVRWVWMKMRADGTEEEVSSELIHNEGLTSSIQVTPYRQEDYGRLLCRAENEVGPQQMACVISLMPAGPPDMPINCSAVPVEQDEEEVEELRYEIGQEQVHNSLSSSVSSSIIIRCVEGFDGGLQQFFLLEAWQNGRLLANKTSEFPEWIINGVQMDGGVTLNIVAHNSRGHSEPYALEVKPSNAQQHAAPDYPGIAAIAPLLGAVVGAVGVIVLLLAVGIFIAKRAPQTSQRKTDGNLQRTSTIPDGFDPDVVKSIQRNPPSLDVLPNLQDQDDQAGSSSLCFASDTMSDIQKQNTNVSKAKNYEQMLSKNAEEQLRFTSLPRQQKSSNQKGTRKENHGHQYTLSPSNDSGVSESESDSEIKDLVSKSKSAKQMKKDSKQTYTNLLATEGVPSHLTANLADHLAEPSTSSGDSGIQSSSSTKPFSLFSTTDDKSRNNASPLAKEFHTHMKHSGNMGSFSPQSIVSGQQLFSPSPIDYTRDVSSYLQINSPSSVTNLPHPSISKIAEEVATKSIYMKNHMPFTSSGVEGRLNHLEYGRPVTILEGDHEEVLLLRRTLPRSAGNSKSRRNSAVGQASDKIYDFSPTYHTSSSDIHNLGYSISPINDIRQGVQRQPSESVLPSPSSNFNYKDNKISMKDSGDRGYKFPFTFNNSERESSV